MQEYEDFFNGVAYEDMPFEYIPREKDKGYFNFPIKILIGSGTASAAEDFLVNIYELPQRPTLIGEQTLGSTGAPYVFILPHNAMAKVCTLQIKFPYSNKIFTKGGIIPDIQISPTIDDYFNEYDRVLEETLQTF